MQRAGRLTRSVDWHLTGHIDHRGEALQGYRGDRFEDLLVVPAGLTRLLVEVHGSPAALLQHRLEVAQHVQRMLRGVDMNYQLGEILLMFKLLTPDQLLAASLVSYGLISTAQISALGRIRQELNSIGLEYDLESLLVLFRILTPEQLREVRASWIG